MIGDPGSGAPRWGPSGAPDGPESAPAAVRSIRFDVAGGVTAPRHARRRLAVELDGLLGGAESEHIELLVSELVTDCVRHAGRTGAGQRIAIHAMVAADRLRIDVRGRLPRTGRRPLGRRVGHEGSRSLGRWATDKGGRPLGLVLLDRVASDWGVADDAQGGLWVEFDRRGDLL